MAFDKSLSLSVPSYKVDSWEDGLCGPFQLTNDSMTKASLRQMPVLPCSRGSRIGELIWHPNGFLLPLINPRAIKNIYFWLCWVFLAMHGPSLVAVSRSYSVVAENWLLIAVASFVSEPER